MASYLPGDRPLSNRTNVYLSWTDLLGNDCEPFFSTKLPLKIFSAKKQSKKVFQLMYFTQSELSESYWIVRQELVKHEVNYADFVCVHFNTLRRRQNRRHFPDDFFKCIFLNGNVWIPIKNSLKFVPKGPINNIPALVWIMAWRRQATSHYLNQG